MELKVLPLHNHPDYLKACCDLINDEWKRSDTARLHSLRSSCDHLPTSLILLRDKELIGHLKLSAIPSIKSACFVESVVIRRALRGNGFGSVLMREAETYCRDTLGLETIYLSTRGQEEFYAKLGYDECLPVSIYGNYVPNKTIAMQQVGENNMEKKCGGNAPRPPPLPEGKATKSRKTFMKKAL